jgi:hypothetical protein
MSTANTPLIDGALVRNGGRSASFPTYLLSRSNFQISNLKLERPNAGHGNALLLHTWVIVSVGDRNSGERRTLAVENREDLIQPHAGRCLQGAVWAPEGLPGRVLCTSCTSGQVSERK